MTFHENSIRLIEDVSKMFGLTGSELAINLMYKDPQKIQLLYESSGLSDFDSWLTNLVTEIKGYALRNGEFLLFNNFFPNVINSKMLGCIFETILIAYNANPLIDSGEDEYSEEGIIQVKRFRSVQEFVLTILLNNFDDYKKTAQNLIDNGIELDDDVYKSRFESRPSQQIKRWRKEHDYYLPEKIIELLELISKSRRKDNDNQEMPAFRL